MIWHGARDLFLGTGQALSGESEGRINILLLGRAGERYPGRNLTDTVMLLSLDMKKKRAGLLSLPRDLFAPIPGTGLSTKLNSLYQIGLNENVGTEILRDSVAEITGLPIHYSVMIDFDGFERMIDALGGIRVDVQRDIHDERYPGKNYSYETFD
jgi:LCP family protein required for cell wall assembly